MILDCTSLHSIAARCAPLQIRTDFLDENCDFEMILNFRAKNNAHELTPTPTKNGVFGEKTSEKQKILESANSTSEIFSSIFVENSVAICGR